MGKVEKITLDELVRHGLAKNQVPNSVYNQEQTKKENRKKKIYISKLSDDEIAKFFAPLDYITHMRVGAENDDVEPFIIVECDNYIIMFNDHTRKTSTSYAADPVSSSKLDRLAEIMGTTVDQLVDTAITVDLLGNRFPETYPESHAKFLENNIKASVKELPSDLKKFFGSAIEVQSAKNKATFNMNEYGMANIESLNRD